jgi:hypothetical protein
MTTPVDIGEVAVDNAASYLEETRYPHSAAMLRALRAALTARDELLRKILPDLESAVLGKPVMLGPALGEVRMMIAKGDAK